MRSEFEKWFKTTEAYKLIEEMNYFKVDLFTFKEHRSQYQHSVVQIAYMTYQHQQSKIDELTKQRDSFIKAYEIEVDKSVELQKRVDESESKLLKLSEFIYGCGDFREYSRGELIGTQRTLKEILIGVSLPSGELEQALKGGNK